MLGKVFGWILSVVATLSLLPVVLWLYDCCIHVNINKATADDLFKKLGIPRRQGRQIVKCRKQNGRFSTVEDIRKVPCISQETIDKIKKKGKFRPLVPFSTDYFRRVRDHFSREATEGLHTILGDN